MLTNSTASLQPQPRCSVCGSSGVSRRAWAMRCQAAAPSGGTRVRVANLADPSQDTAPPRSVARSTLLGLLGLEASMVWFQCEGCGDTLKKVRPVPQQAAAAAAAPMHV